MTANMEDNVNLYMESNWDQTAYRAAHDRIGGIPVRGGKTMLPELPSAEPGAAAAANVMGGLVAGTFDAVVWTGLKAIPGLGIVPMFLDLVKGSRDAFVDEAATDDAGNLSEGILALRLTRNIADFIGGAASNIGDATTLLEDGSGLLATLFPPIAIATGVAAIIGSVCNGIALGCDAFKVSADTAMMIGNVFLSRRLRAEGNERGANKAMGLAQNNAVDLIFDSIGFVTSFVELCSVNTVGGGAAVTRTAQAITEATSNTAGQAARAVAHHAGGKIQGALTGPGQARRVIEASGVLPGQPSAVNTIPPRQMPAGSGQAASIISPARQATNTILQESSAGLEASKPILWHQKMIDDFKKDYTMGDRANDALDWVTTPSAWIRSLFGSLPFAHDVASWMITATADNPEMMAQAIQAALPGGDLLQPVLTQVSEWISTHSKDIKKMSAEFNETMQTHQMSLQVITDALGSGRELLTAFSGMTDAKGPIETGGRDLIANLDRMIIPDLSIPAITPELVEQFAAMIPGLGGIASAIAATPLGSLLSGLLEQAREPIEEHVNSFISSWNARVEGWKTQATTAMEEKIAEIDAVIDEKTATINDWISQLESELADGGEIQQMLQAQYVKVQEMVAAADAAIQAWNGELNLTVEGGVQWLMAVAQAVTDHMDATRGHTHEELVTQWTEVLDQEAQPWVTEWKAAHAEEVANINYPEVPEAEIAAALQATSAVEEQLNTYEERLPPGGHTNVVRRYRTILSDIRGTIQGTRGQRGEGPIQQLWGAEDRLVRLEDNLTAQAGQASRGDNQQMADDLAAMPTPDVRTGPVAPI